MSGMILKSQTTYDPKTKIWSGTKVKNKYGPESSVGQEALKSLMKDPEHIAQICYHNGKCYTNRDIATMSIRVAQHFKTLQVEQCDVIGICASNSDFIAPLVFGAMLCGLTVSPLDPSFDIDGIKHIFSITKPKFMFCDGAVYSSVVTAFEQCNLQANIYTMKDHINGVPEFTEFLQETGTEADYKPEPLKFGYLQNCVILCSSGTTGLPKGVCVSHAILLNSNMFNPSPSDILLTFSTLYWTSGVFTLIKGTLCGSTRVISDKCFSPEDFFNILEKYKVTMVFTPPSQIAMSIASDKIKDYDMSSLTDYVCGGSAVSYSLVEKIKPYMPNALFSMGYGTSEVACVIAIGEVVPSGATGQLGQNVQVKVVNTEGESLGPDESGEFCMLPLFKWGGYYGNSAATQATYENGEWIRSGDVGYIDKDGNLFIVDRIKEILKYNNFHFSPTEIENIIHEIPGVAEVSVCGLADIVSTHLPAAAIVKSFDSTLTEKQVYDYVATKMAHFKHLRGGVFFLKQLPKTVSGKTLRRKVTEICEKLRNERKCGNECANVEYTPKLETTPA